MRSGIAVAALAAAAVLAGCSRHPAAPFTIGEDDRRQLTEAAAMLDPDSMDPAALADTMTGNAADTATDNQADLR